MPLNLNGKFADASQPFSKEVQAELSTINLDDSLEGRPRIMTVPIDLPETKVREDGFHLHGSANTLSIDIIDPSAIDPQGAVAQAVFERGRDYSDGIHMQRMLPPELRSELLTLTAKDGLWRPTVSALFDLTTAPQFQATAALVGQDLSHHDVQAILKSGDPHYYLPLINAITSLSTRVGTRVHQVLAALSEDAPSKIAVKKGDVQSAIQRLMLFFNQHAAQFAAKNEIPTIYKNQRLVPRRNYQHRILAEFEQFPESEHARKAFQGILPEIDIKTTFSTEPETHAGLGGAVYASYTNPLRSAEAFANMQNLSAALRRQPLPYDHKQMQAISKHLSAASKGRKKKAEKTREARMEKLLNQKVNLNDLTKKDLKALLIQSTKLPAPPEHLPEIVEQLRNSADAGKLKLLSIIIWGPEMGSEAWKELRHKALSCLPKVGALRRVLVERKQLGSFNWEFDLQNPEQGIWETRAHLEADGQEFRLPYYIRIDSPRAAVRQTFKHLIKGYIEGTLGPYSEEEQTCKEIVIHNPVPIDFELPTADQARTIYDKQAANKLHVVSSVAGLGRPSVRRTQATPQSEEEAPQHLNQIYGLRLIAPIMGATPQTRTESATNHTASLVMAQIRAKLGLLELTAPVVHDHRARVWQRKMDKRKTQSMVYRVPRISEASLIEHRESIMLTLICKKNDWPIPEVQITSEDHQDTCTMQLQVGTKLYKGEAMSELGEDLAEDQAAIQILKQITDQFQPTAEQKAIEEDKADPSTPLGLLLSTPGISNPQIKFTNQTHHIFAQITITHEGKQITSTRSTTKNSHSARQALHEAAQNLLADHLKHTETPAIPNIETPTQKIPPGYLCMKNAIKELRLICLQQGYPKPQFQVELAVGKKKQTRYTASIQMPDGTVIEKKATHKVPAIAMMISAIYMLQHLEPQYRGNAINIRKIELLKEQHDLPIEGPIFEEIEEDGKTYHKCTYKLQVSEDKELAGENASSWSKTRSQEMAAKWLLMSYAHYTRRGLWLQNRAAELRKEIKATNREIKPIF